MGKDRAISARTVRYSYHDLEPSHIPERYGVVQTGKDILYARPCVAIIQPA